MISSPVAASILRPLGSGNLMVSSMPGTVRTGDKTPEAEYLAALLESTHGRLDTGPAGENLLISLSLYMEAGLPVMRGANAESCHAKQGCAAAELIQHCS